MTSFDDMIARLDRALAARASVQKSAITKWRPTTSPPTRNRIQDTRAGMASRNGGGHTFNTEHMQERFLNMNRYPQSWGGYNKFNFEIPSVWYGRMNGTKVMPARSANDVTWVPELDVDPETGRYIPKVDADGEIQWVPLAYNDLLLRDPRTGMPISDKLRMREVRRKDRNGNLIPVLNSEGDQTWEYETDDNGNFVYETDDNGNRIPLGTDSEGRPLYNRNLNAFDPRYMYNSSRAEKDAQALNEWMHVSRFLAEEKAKEELDAQGITDPAARGEAIRRARTAAVAPGDAERWLRGLWGARDQDIADTRSYRDQAHLLQRINNELVGHGQSPLFDYKRIGWVHDAPESVPGAEETYGPVLGPLLKRLYEQRNAATTVGLNPNYRPVYNEKTGQTEYYRPQIMEEPVVDPKTGKKTMKRTETYVKVDPFNETSNITYRQIPDIMDALHRNFIATTRDPEQVRAGQATDRSALSDRLKWSMEHDTKLQSLNSEEQKLRAELKTLKQFMNDPNAPKDKLARVGQIQGRLKEIDKERGALPETQGEADFATGNAALDRNGQTWNDTRGASNDDAKRFVQALRQKHPDIFTEDFTDEQMSTLADIFAYMSPETKATALNDLRFDFDRPHVFAPSEHMTGRDTTRNADLQEDLDALEGPARNWLASKKNQDIAEQVIEWGSTPEGQAMLGKYHIGTPRKDETKADRAGQVLDGALVYMALKRNLESEIADAQKDLRVGGFGNAISDARDALQTEFNERGYDTGDISMQDYTKRYLDAWNAYRMNNDPKPLQEMGIGPDENGQMKPDEFLMNAANFLRTTDPAASANNSYIAGMRSKLSAPETEENLASNGYGQLFERASQLLPVQVRKQLQTLMDFNKPIPDPYGGANKRNIMLLRNMGQAWRDKDSTAGQRFYQNNPDASYYRDLYDLTLGLSDARAKINGIHASGKDPETGEAMTDQKAIDKYVVKRFFTPDRNHRTDAGLRVNLTRILPEEQRRRVLSFGGNAVLNAGQQDFLADGEKQSEISVNAPENDVMPDQVGEQSKSREKVTSSGYAGVARGTRIGADGISAKDRKTIEDAVRPRFRAEYASWINSGKKGGEPSWEAMMDNAIKTFMTEHPERVISERADAIAQAHEDSDKKRENDMEDIPESNEKARINPANTTAQVNAEAHDAMKAPERNTVPSEKKEVKVLSKKELNAKAEEGRKANAREAARAEISTDETHARNTGERETAVGEMRDSESDLNQQGVNVKNEHRGYRKEQNTGIAKSVDGRSSMTDLRNMSLKDMMGDIAKNSGKEGHPYGAPIGNVYPYGVPVVHVTDREPGMPDDIPTTRTNGDGITSKTLEMPKKVDPSDVRKSDDTETVGS